MPKSSQSKGTANGSGLILPASSSANGANQRSDEIRLTSEVKLGLNIIEMFDEVADMGGAASSDIFIPCLNSSALAAVSPLAVMPIGMPPPSSPAALEEIISNLIGELEPQLATQNVKPDLYLLHLNVSGQPDDLLIVTLQSKLIGGSRRHEWFRIWADERRVEGPLSAPTLTEHPFFGTVVQSLREASFHLRQTGDATRARELLTDVLETDPNCVEAMMMLAHLYIAIGNQITASGYIADTLRVQPDHLPALLLHIRFLLDAGDIEQAEEVLANLRTKTHDDPEVPLLQARIALTKNEWADATGYIHEALALDPENQEALMLKKVMEEGPEVAFGDLIADVDEEDFD